MKNFSFTLYVEPGFYINLHLPKEIFKKLCEVLELRFNPQNPFSTRAFFMEFNDLQLRHYLSLFPVLH